MLFMIVSTHSPETCPMVNMDSREKLLSSTKNLDSVAKALGVSVMGTWVDAPAHKIFMLVDAPKPEALSKMARELHLIEWNTSITHPVATMQEVVAQLQLKK